MAIFFVLNLFRIFDNNHRPFFSALSCAFLLGSIYCSLVYTYFIATNYSNGVGSQVLATLVKTLPLHIQINQNM